MKIGMIGLGAMGNGMARNLAKANLLTAVYNRTVVKANVLAVELNVSACTSVEQLAMQVDIVLLCISDDEAVSQVISELAEVMKPESVVIDMSTVSSETAKESAALLLQKQVAFLDAPISGGVEGAIKGTLSIMVGGDKTVLDKVSYILEAMSSRIVYMGATGAGQGAKAVNQIMVAGINQAVCEALAFGKSQGLVLDKVIDVVSAGAAGNWFLQHRGKSMVKGTFDPGFKLKLHHKDLAICKKMVENNDVSSDIIDKTLADYQMLMNQGFGSEDISALYRLKNRDIL